MPEKPRPLPANATQEQINQWARKDAEWAARQSMNECPGSAQHLMHYDVDLDPYADPPARPKKP